MVKKLLLYFFFQIKSAFRILPRLIICTLAAGIIIAAAGVCAVAVLDTDETVTISVAAVMPPDDNKIAMGFDIISRMESMKKLCNFIPVESEDAALELMSKGEVSIVAVLPAGMVEAINDGTNIPARLILPENASLEALVFGSTIDAGSKTLAYVQSGIYAVDYWLWNHDMDSKVSHAEDYLNEFYTIYALNRSQYFEGEAVSATGTSSTMFYYICSGFVLVLLLCGLAVSGVFSRTPATVMKLHRISPIFNIVSSILSVSAAFFVLFGTIVCVSSAFLDFELSVIGILLILLIIVSIVSFICCISSFTSAGTSLSSVLVTFLLSAVMMYACGRILPSAYIPKAIAVIGNYLPMTYWCRTFDSMISGSVSLSAIIPVISFTVVFTGISVAMTYIKGRNN